ncbi:MAG: sigma 54-interacting transcriptional regulator [Bacillota bacterium]
MINTKGNVNLNCMNDKRYIDILQGVFLHSPNGIIVTNKDLIIELFNDNAERLTGLKREDVVGRRFYDAFPHMYLNMEGNYSEETAVNTVLINGKSLHTKSFEIKENIEPTAVVFMMQDLSKDIKLNMELEKSQHMIEELEGILEGSFDGILVTDGEGNVLLVNQSYERITSIKKEELYGKNMRDLINPVWMKNSVVFLAIKEKKPVSLPHTTRENKNIIVTGTPIFSKHGEVKEVVVNARDISEIYELREELLKAKEMEKLYFNNITDSTHIKGQGKSVVVVSEAIKEVFSLAHKVSNFDATVLIEGESGSGKEEVAKYIHNNSLRKDNSLVAINCGAIPEQLLESELFGYEKGAFTGASREGKIGLYEAADGGTLFLDEIGEMPLNLQVKLLRVLETGEITRVGAVKSIPVDVRVIAATNKNLEDKIKKQEFREDLYYRLNVIQIKVPPLRERIEDIAPLALHFLQQFNAKYGQSKKLTYDVIKELEEYPWAGNIRQLKNMMENMVVVSNNEYLQINDLPWHKTGDRTSKNTPNQKEDSEIISLEMAIEQTERKLLQKAKEKYKSTRKIANVLEVDQSTVARKMKKYGLSAYGDE